MSGGNGPRGPFRAHPPDKCAGPGTDGDGEGENRAQVSAAVSSAAAGFIGMRTVKVVSPGSLATVMKPR